jgi:hypothetical protein
MRSASVLLRRRGGPPGNSAGGRTRPVRVGRPTHTVGMAVQRNEALVRPADPHVVGPGSFARRPWSEPLRATLCQKRYGTDQRDPCRSNVRSHYRGCELGPPAHRLQERGRPKLGVDVQSKNSELGSSPRPSGVRLHARKTLARIEQRPNYQPRTRLPAVLNQVSPQRVCRASRGVLPVRRLNARVNALTSS